jgi:hypothetical protein
MGRIAALAACVAVATACKSPPPPDTGTGPRRFSTPQEAVDEANVLLDGRDWKGLARCYDLSLTPRVDIEELRSGRFFVDESAPATAGPTAVSRYRQPFPPGSEFLEATPVGDPSALPCIWRVRTVRSIDQGGGAVQRVTRDCSMIERPEGWQFLPPAPIDDGQPPATRRAAPAGPTR